MDFFRVLIQKLIIFKNNSALLLPIVIALVGILVFIPTQLMSSKLKKRIESESVSKIGNSIQSLSETAVSREQWEMERERQGDYARDAERIALLSKQSTQRELLSYKIFPEPKDKSQFTFVEFGRRYCAALEALVTGINARDCPTDAELNRALDKSSGISGPESGYRSMGSYMRTMTSGTSYRKGSDVKNTIADEICRERAESASVYMNPVNLSGYGYWKEYKYESQVGEAVEDCWYYQLAYWVIEDVIDTIGTMNAIAGSNSVLTSPVKRLISVNFNLGGGRYGMAGSYAARGLLGKSRGERAGVDDRPVYVLSLQDASMEPYTGRYCNKDIDVVHFSVAVVVSAKAVLPFMQQLCSAKEHKFSGFSGNEQEQISKHNQITILESKISSINREELAHSLYRYGDEAVVELDLTCEYIFNEAGYEEIKPASVKEAKESEEKTRKGR